MLLGLAPQAKRRSAWLPGQDDGHAADGCQPYGVLPLQQAIQQRSALGVEKSELHAHPVGSVRLGWVELAHPSHAARTPQDGRSLRQGDLETDHLAHRPRFAAGQENTTSGHVGRKARHERFQVRVAQVESHQSGMGIVRCHGKSSIGLRAQGVNRIRATAIPRQAWSGGRLSSKG